MTSNSPQKSAYPPWPCRRTALHSSSPCKFLASGPRDFATKSEVTQPFLSANKSQRGGRASPRLKDAGHEISPSSYLDLYQELVLTVRKIYRECKLAHADLSEHNILYHDSHFHIIDISPSVKHDHPHAFVFVRNDVKCTEESFGGGEWKLWASEDVSSSSQRRRSKSTGKLVSLTLKSSNSG